MYYFFYSDINKVLYFILLFASSGSFYKLNKYKDIYVLTLLLYWPLERICVRSNLYLLNRMYLAWFICQQFSLHFKWEWERGEKNGLLLSIIDPPPNVFAISLPKLCSNMWSNVRKKNLFFNKCWMKWLTSCTRSTAMGISQNMESEQTNNLSNCKITN